MFGKKSSFISPKTPLQTVLTKQLWPSRIAVDLRDHTIKTHNDRLNEKPFRPSKPNKPKSF